MTPVDQTWEEVEAHLADDGPVDAAYRWLASFLAGEDFYATWAAVDPDLRLVLARAWVVANQAHPDVSRYDLEAATLALASERPSHDLLVPFGMTQLAELRSAWPWIDLENVAAESEPHPVAPGYEAITLIPMLPGQQAQRVTEPAEIDQALRLLMHHVDGRWLVAGLHADEPPLPQASPAKSGPPSA
jgi:hypothetical protein